MTEIKYDESKGSDKSTVITDGGEVVRAQNVNSVSGQVIYDKSKGSTQCTVITEDGKTVRAMNVVDLGGGGGGGAVSSVNGKTGAVVLGAKDVNAVPQYSTMPTASASNVGEIAQYSGETIPDVPASAVATQTVGSGLTDLSVNVDTFIGVEQPSGAETVSFVASVIPETITPTTATVQSNSTITIDPVVFLQAEHTYNPSNNYSSFYISYYDSTQVEIRVLYESGSTASDIVAISALSDWGITIDGELQSGDAMSTSYVPAVVSWAKDSESVDISAYGISYTGTPADGDTISVAYTPGEKGITQGYFYANQPKYSDASATISQTQGATAGRASFTTISGQTEISATPQAIKTWLYDFFGLAPDSSTIAIAWDTTENSMVVVLQPVGNRIITNQQELENQGFVFSKTFEQGDEVSCDYVAPTGLTDLSVNVDTFIEAEQPTQDETVGFVAGVNPDTSVVDDATAGLDYTFDGQTVIDYFNGLWGYHNSLMNEYVWGITYAVYTGGGDEGWVMSRNQDGSYSWGSALATGITINGTPNIGDYIAINSTMGSTTWSKNGTTVDLAEYGISYSGTPADGDTLTVAYTAPAPIGYYWNQTDVQPSSGGGNAGIEWKTKVDLPAEYTGDPYNAAPYYTIVGGLPDGEYEFYFLTKTQNETELPVGEVIFKTKLIINNSAQTAYAQMGYVFDGNYMQDGNNVYGSDNLDIWNWVKVNNNDLILFSIQRPWASAILVYNNHQTVPECFKLSAIKNVETGQEYVAVGAISLDGSYPAYTSEYNSRIKLASIVSLPSMPSYFSNPTFNASEANNWGGLSINTNAAEVYVRLKSGNDEFYGFVYRTKGNSYEQEILVSTGVFANCVFGSSSNRDVVYLSFGGTPAFVDTIYVSAGSLGGFVSGINVGSYDSTIQTTAFDFVRFGKTSRFTTPTANQIGGIIQYIGETDANYTKGYSYTGVGTIITVPESFTPSEYSLPDFTLTIDDSNFMSALVSVTGWSEDYIREMLQNGYSWFISYDGANSSINYVNWGAYGNFINDAVTQCFTVTTTQTADVSCNFVVTYTPESQVVQNGHWELLPVQPLDLTGVTGYDATKTQVLKNVQGVLTWVDEV